MEIVRKTEINWKKSLIFYYMNHFGIVRADEQAITGSVLGIFNADTVIISLPTVNSTIYKHILLKSEDIVAMMYQYSVNIHRT